MAALLLSLWTAFAAGDTGIPELRGPAPGGCVAVGTTPEAPAAATWNLAGPVAATAADATLPGQAEPDGVDRCGRIAFPALVPGTAPRSRADPRTPSACPGHPARGPPRLA